MYVVKGITECYCPREKNNFLNVKSLQISAYDVKFLKSHQFVADVIDLFISLRIGNCNVYFEQSKNCPR